MDKQKGITPKRTKKASTPSLPEGVKETFNARPDLKEVFISNDGKDWRFSKARAIKAFGESGYKTVKR